MVPELRAAPARDRAADPRSLEALVSSHRANRRRHRDADVDLSRSVSEIGRRLRAPQQTAILTNLQRAAEQRQARKELLLLQAVTLSIGDLAALAEAASRRLEQTRCAHCRAQVQLPGEVADLIARLRLPEERER